MLNIKALSLNGTGLMLGSALMFAVMDGFIKIIGPSFRIWDIAFYRFGFGILILFAFFGERQSLLKGANPRLLILRGVLGSLAFLCIGTSIRLIPISTAMVLFFTFPVFTALFSSLIYREPIKFLEIVCIGVAILGMAVIFDFRFEGVAIGQVLAISGAVFAGFTVTIIKKLRENHGSGNVFMYFCIIGTLITFPAFIAKPYFPQSLTEWTMIGIIAVASVIGQLLMTQGLRYCKSWEGGVLMTTELVFTSILGILFLNEQVAWQFWLGGTMILVSIIALQITTKESKIKP